MNMEKPKNEIDYLLNSGKLIEAKKVFFKGA